jgi:hypothetical protein
MKKRLVSLTLALVLACSLCVSAFAAAPGMNNFTTSASYTEGTFSDVASSAWYYNAVKQCYEYGLMGGKGAGRFDPNGSLTIAEAIVMADQINSIYNTGAVTKPAGDPWYAGYVEYAVNNGIIKSGDFSNYTLKATRAQMAYIFAHALPEAEYAVLAAVKSVPDVKSTDKYGSEIYKLYNAGILSGSDRYGHYLPNSNIKRCEAAAILRRVALANQRVETILLKDIKYDIVKFCMPADTVYTTESGMPTYVYSTIADKTCSTVLGKQALSTKDPSVKITVFTMSELADQIVENVKASGATITVNSSKTVYFGKIPAYRYDLTTVKDGVTVTQYDYEFITGGYLYEVAFTSQNASMLSILEPTLTINGYSAK